MAWTFRCTDELADKRNGYEKDLLLRAQKLTTEAEAQELLNEDRDWQEFSLAVQAFESNASDPTKLPTVTESGTILPGFFAFRKHRFTLVYKVDSETQQATALLLYREPPVTERSSLLDYKSGSICHQSNFTGSSVWDSAISV
jgi:hypothetical protein